MPAPGLWNLSYGPQSATQQPHAQWVLTSSPDPCISRVAAAYPGSVDGEGGHSWDSSGTGDGDEAPGACEQLSVVLPADVKLTPIEFGNLQKMDGPTEQCQDPVLPAPPMNCSTGFVSPSVNSQWGWGGAEVGGL